MKTITRILTLLVISAALTGCGSDGGSVTSNGVVSGNFVDNALDSFRQTGGVASNETAPEKVINFVFPSAYAAASGTYSCVSGDTATFEASAFGGSLFDVSVTCSSTVDNDIRAGLLKSLLSKKIIVDVAESATHKANAQRFTFPSSDTSGKVTITMYGLGAYAGGSTSLPSDCAQQYEFDMNTGSVRIYISNGTTIGSTDNTLGNGLNAGCSLSGGDSSDFDSGFETTAKFRFKDGKIEFNTDNQEDFSSSSGAYERWCLDDNTDGSCDAI